MALNMTDPVLCPKCGTNERRRLAAAHRCLYCSYECCVDWARDASVGRVRRAREAIRDAGRTSEETGATTEVTAVVSPVTFQKAPFTRRLFYP